jgi:hypothetical protein
MSSNSKGTIVRLVVLLLILVAAVGALIYMQNRPPSPESIESSIQNGELWGEPLEVAKQLFKQEPTSLPLESTDSPSAERWLFTVHSSPPTYYMIFVQTGKITHAQKADETGKVIGG